MFTEKDIVDQLTESVTARVTTVIRENLSEMVQQEISKALARALGEGQFYRTLSDEVIDSMVNVYSEINSVKKSLEVGSSDQPLNLLNNSDSILDSIVQATEKATLQILDYLEEIQEAAREIKRSVDVEVDSGLKEKFEHLDQLILNTMTELSFQDLTGQQIRRVVQSLKQVEGIIYDAYVTSEILKKSKANSPEQDIEEIREKARDMIEGAKSKKTLADQEGVDSLLEEFGF